MTGRSALVSRLLQIWSFLWNSVVKVLWLCAYSTVTVALTLYFFVANDQGLDLLRISGEPGRPGWNILFVLGTAALGLTVWYSSRLLLGSHFPRDSLDDRSSRFVREWLPRGFGFAVPAGVVIGFLRVDSPWLALLFAALALVLLAFFIGRRRFMLKGSRVMLDTRVSGLDRTSKWVIGIAVSLSFLLVIGFLVSKVSLPQWLGAPAIVVLGLAGIALFGSMVLTYWFLAHGQPGGTAIALVIAVLAGFVNDNHWVRVVGESAAIGGEVQPQPRLRPAGQREKWREAHAGFTPVDGREPVILVAAAGGGIRAAYWTASALAALEEAVPGFSRNLFAISGVSGGSLGAATYVALKQKGADAAPGGGGLKEQVRSVLKEDFLSPVLAGLLFPDLMQRFVPFPFPPADRQRFLEFAWEAAVGDYSDSFEEPFLDLYAGADRYRLPGLLLNATVVNSGRRAITSNMDISEFTDTLDLLADRYSTHNVPLSAAAGMSARFTYVSPPGTLQRTDEDGDTSKLRVVDGGYFENSGAATAMDLLAALNTRDNNLYPILVLIRNDPATPPVCDRYEAQGRVFAEVFAGDDSDRVTSELLNEVAAPVRALLQARTARGRLAEVDAARAVERDYDGAVIEISIANVLHGRLDSATSDAERRRLRKTAVEPPLGWSLSESIREEMDHTLDNESGDLADEFAILKKLLGGSATAYPSCRANQAFERGTP
ncbi:MAG: hypothetical protein ABFS23_07770 [Pseudomonadota bacterium]